MKKKLLFALLSFAILGANAQTALFPTTEFLDVNRFNTAHLVHGDMWWTPATTPPLLSTQASCEYPKATGKHASYGGNIWMSAVDDSGKLHISAQKFRENNTTDYWPGPLNASDILTYTTSQSWAKIWKINRSDINLFLAISTHTIFNTSTVLLEWPAKGNPYAAGNAHVPLSISSDMAPFVDVDHDGIYNALKGDYPDMKGDQMLWWVFSDNGPTHTITNGRPLKIECHAMAYAYNRGSAVDNMLFYEFTMYNKSPFKYRDFRFALYSEANLGYDRDDYIAFDSSHRMAIEYNGALQDGANGLNSYGDHSPITGLSFIEMPGDVCSGSMPVGSFDYFINFPFSPIANPDNDTSFNNYMRYKRYSGKPFPYGGNYAFPISKAVMQCDSAYTFPNQNYVLASGNYTFLPNSKTKLGMVFMATDTTGNVCGHLDFKAITSLADTAWQVYCSPLFPLSTHDIALAQKTLKVYPNPARTILFMETNTAQNEGQVLVYDALGRLMNVSYVGTAKGFELNISALAPGVYSLLYRNGSTQQSQTFIKE